MGSTLTLRQKFELATRAALGIFRGDPGVSQQVLNAIFPRRGDPPRRGTPGLLRAYSDMPWLRAVTTRVATMTATPRWHIYAVQRATNTGAKRYVRDYALQRAPFGERRKMLTSLARTGELVEIFEHPFLDAWQGGGSYVTGMQTRKLLQIYLDLVGEAFLIKERNAAGAVVGLWPVPPSWIITVPTPLQPWYWIIFRNQRLQIPDTEVLWAFEPDPYNPYGRATGMANSLADELDTQEFASKHIRGFFFNNARPDFVAWVKGDPNTPSARVSETELVRLKQRWLQEHQSVFRRWAPHFVNRELGIYEFKQDLQAIQAIPLLQHERDTIVQVYGVPPEIFGIINDSKRSTIDMAAFHMGLFVVQPRLESQRDILQAHLLPEYDERLVIEYDSPIPEDREFAINVVNAAPWAFSMDDVRAIAALPTLGPEKGGDLHPVPINVTLTAEEDLVAAALPAPAAGEGDGGEGTDSGGSGLGAEPGVDDAGATADTGSSGRDA